MSESRRLRRAKDPQVQAKAKLYSSGGGYGWGNSGASRASGQTTHVNPFVLPKATGLNQISKAFPNNYYVEWNITTWRNACDQATKMGYPVSLATMYSFAFESSSFIQSLFRELEVAISKIPVVFKDEKGNINEALSKDICEKKWFRDLIKECIFSNFWGFSCINFDPIEGKIYKYPMQNIDPINRFLKENTYNFYDGVRIEDHANLLFFQPSTNYEQFLGWMQPITRDFIQMNLNSNNWIAGGTRLAFPLLTIGYPENDNGIDSDGYGVNQYRIQAENLAENIDPSQAMVIPYTRDIQGNVQKAIEVSAEGNTSSGSAHKIYSDFNDTKKNEIREMILLSTLTSSHGSSGSYSLGEIHERKYESVIDYTMDTAIAMLNDEFLSKIKTFYKGFPDNVKLAINKSKSWTIEELKTLSPVLKDNGVKLTLDFFHDLGFNPEYITQAEEIGIVEEKPKETEKEVDEIEESKTKFSTLIKKKMTFR